MVPFSGKPNKQKTNGLDTSGFASPFFGVLERRAPPITITSCSPNILTKRHCSIFGDSIVLVTKIVGVWSTRPITVSVKQRETLVFRFSNMISVTLYVMVSTV